MAIVVRGRPYPPSDYKTWKDTAAARLLHFVDLTR